MVAVETWKKLTDEFASRNVTLVAVSKKKPVSDILELYNLGQRDFGENYVQELVEKKPLLPADIRWHFIGHLQSNKVKEIAPYVHLIHAVDSFSLLKEINKQAQKHERTIPVLLQMYIADEETKFGLDEAEITCLIKTYREQIEQPGNISINGLMGMATNTDDEAKIAGEFRSLNNLFLKLKAEFFANDPAFNTRSIGMSSDYRIAMQEGGNMVRIGSLLFGPRG